MGSQEVKGSGDKQCKAVIREQCGQDTGVNTCLKCGDGSSYKCEKCCPGLTPVTKGEYTWCVPDSPDTKCSKDNPRGCFSIPYERNGQIVTYLKPGQKTEECPTGLMFPSSWNEGYGQGGDGRFQFQMIDKLEVPEDLPAGNYQLSWRWDCEQTPQVWNSCADIVIE